MKWSDKDRKKIQREQQKNRIKFFTAKANKPTPKPPKGGKRKK